MTDQFSAHDMATAASEGFRAGQGSIQTVADGRWYMVNKDGMATLCTDRADAEKEAADAQSVWPHMGPHRAVRLIEASFEAADMATAAAQGFRDGVASVAASARACATHSDAAQATQENIMTNPTPHGQEPEALRLAQELDAVPETGADPQTIQEAAAELRRQHARIAELEARIKTMAEEHADELMVAHLDGMRAEQAIPGVQWQCGPQANGFTAPQADSVQDLQPVHDAVTIDLLNERVAYLERKLKEADSVLEDAAQVEIDLFNDLNRIYGNTLTAYAKEMCRLGYRKTNAARKQGANHD